MAFNWVLPVTKNIAAIMTIAAAANVTMALSTFVSSVLTDSSNRLWLTRISRLNNLLRLDGLWYFRCFLLVGGSKVGFK